MVCVCVCVCLSLGTSGDEADDKCFFLLLVVFLKPDTVVLEWYLTIFVFCFVCSLTCQKHKVKAIHYTINSIGFHENNSKWPPNKFVKKLTTLCLWILFLLYFVLRDYWRGHYWHLTGTVIFCLRCLNMDGAYILILYSMPSSLRFTLYKYFIITNNIILLSLARKHWVRALVWAAPGSTFCADSCFGIHSTCYHTST